MGVFDRGDVVSVPLDPAMGHEQKGTRPALVLTPKEFNRLGDVLVAPITQGRAGTRSRSARRVGALDGFAGALADKLRQSADCSSSTGVLRQSTAQPRPPESTQSGSELACRADAGSH